MIGIDINLEDLDKNNSCDKKIVGSVYNIPLPDSSIDIVYSDWVAEHIEYPEMMIKEIYRVLRPGGYYLFRTGNLCHYSYFISSVTPQWFHKIFANKVRGLPEMSHEPHISFYRFNSIFSISNIMKKCCFQKEALNIYELEPSYLMFSLPSFILGVIYERIVNSNNIFMRFRACMWIFTTLGPPLFTSITPRGTPPGWLSSVNQTSLLLSSSRPVPERRFQALPV